jgi:hypothetical protein
MLRPVWCLLALVALLVAKAASTNVPDRLESSRSTPQVVPNDQPIAATGDNDDDVARSVERNLELVADKETTEITEGVTVAELLELRQFSGADCTRERLFKRFFVCDLVQEIAHIKSYCLVHLDRVARYCAVKSLGRDLIDDSSYDWKRVIHELRTLSSMSDQDKKLWLSIVSTPSGNYEALFKHLKSKLLTKGPREGPIKFVHNLFPAEKISRKVLVKKIATLGGGISDIGELASYLAMTRDKETTELVEGVKVAEFLRMNDISKKYCTPEEVQERQKQCSKTGSVRMLRTYCRDCINTMVMACMNGFEKHETIDEWWFGLYRAMTSQTDVLEMLKKFTNLNTFVEEYILRDIKEAREEEIARGGSAAPNTNEKGGGA